jgi:hypothetical protein
MLNAFLILAIGLALIVVYFSAKRRAERAVKDLEANFKAAKSAAADSRRAESNWHSVEDLLAGAQRALDQQDWDKAEDLCQFGFSILESISSASRQTGEKAHRRVRSGFQAPARSL